MLTKKKKIFMLVGMILLLAVTAYLNFALAAKADDDDGDLIPTGNFFTQARSEKAQSRSEELAILDAIIATEGAEFEQQRQAAMDQKLRLTQIMEQETAIEHILKSKGYEDVVVTISMTTNKANVIIKLEELTRDDSVIIFNTVLEQADIDPDNVHIIKV